VRAFVLPLGLTGGEIAWESKGEGQQGVNS
jgi:hypothetical protein